MKRKQYQGLFFAVITLVGLALGGEPEAKEAMTYLKSMVNTEIYSKSEVEQIYTAAAFLESKQDVTLLEEFRAETKDKVGVTSGGQAVLGALFASLTAKNEPLALRYLTIVPPRGVGTASLAAYMGIQGNLGGIPNLFRSYYSAETGFAKSQLLSAIREAFYGLDAGSRDNEHYVGDLDKWYWDNLSKIHVDDEYLAARGLGRTRPIPEGCVLIGIFIVPEKLAKEWR